MASKVLGVIREIILAKQFGTSYIVDAYSIAYSLPTVLFAIFANGFGRSYQAIYARILNANQKILFFSNVINILLVVSIIVTYVCYVFSSEISVVLAPGFDTRTTELTAKFIRIFVMYLPFLTLFSILCAQIYTKENFIFCNFCSYIVVNIIIIMSIYFSPINIMLLAYGHIISICFVTLLLIVYMIKKGFFRYTFVFSFFNYNFKQLCILAIPVGIGIFINQINTIIDRIFASTFGEGVTSALSYADKLQMLPYSLVVSAIITVCTPRINKNFACGNREDGLFYIRQSIMVVLYLSIPIVFILLLFSHQFVQLIFERGVFTSESTKITSACLSLYALGIPFYAFREIASVVLTADCRKNLILKNAMISILANVTLNALFAHFIGYIGLPLATSLSGLIVSIFIIYDMKKINLYAFNCQTMKDFFKIVAVSIFSLFIMRIVVSVTDQFFDNLRYSIIPGTIVFIMIYVVCSFVSNIEITRFICQKFIVKNIKVKE